MAKHISRRSLLGAGIASTGALMGKGTGAFARSTSGPYPDDKGPGREAFWEPGPNKNLVRDLTPGTTSIRLAGYLGYEEGASPAESVQKIRGAGLTAAITSVDTWYPLRESIIQELREALREYDVEVFEVGGYRNILHTDQAERQKNLKHLARCLETADRIGCRMVGTITGSRNPEGNQFGDNYAVHPDNWTMETWKLTVRGIKQILDDTAGMKAVLGMEAQVTTNLDGPLSHKRLMEDAGSDRVKVNLDPTNMIHMFNHFHTTELINECFDLLGEDIYGCHAKDTYVWPHTQTLHIQEVCPGRGNMDYEMYLVRLSRMQWSRALLPEHIPQDQFPEAYSHIRKIASKVGVRIHG